MGQDEPGRAGEDVRGIYAVHFGHQGQGKSPGRTPAAADFDCDYRTRAEWQATDNRRALCRDEGTARRLLHDRGEEPRRTGRNRAPGPVAAVRLDWWAATCV